jgi:uncharacterized cupredoxin-like copper-binding protein
MYYIVEHIALTQGRVVGRLAIMGGALHYVTFGVAIAPAQTLTSIYNILMFRLVARLAVFTLPAIGSSPVMRPATPAPLALALVATHHVTITAREYAFTAPTHVPAGLTVFHLVNHGKVRHEVQIFRFAPNISAAAARKYLSTGDIPDSAADLSGSVLIAFPGDSARYGIEIDLKPGERYALICEFRDAPNTPPHAKLGMFGLVEVEPTTAVHR